jgi:hypothetical protein
MAHGAGHNAPFKAGELASAPKRCFDAFNRLAVIGDDITTTAVDSLPAAQMGQQSRGYSDGRLALVRFTGTFSMTMENAALNIYPRLSRSAILRRIENRAWP